MENKDVYEVENVTERRNVQRDWILGEIHAIQNYLESIEKHVKENKNGKWGLHTPYVFEKTEKIKSSVESIEYRTKLYNERS